MQMLFPLLSSPYVRGTSTSPLLLSFAQVELANPDTFKRALLDKVILRSGENRTSLPVTMVI